MATSGRVILHIDLDCFYSQVEQKRLGIPRQVPVAVQQWEGLIAINYAARALGITRHMRVQEAMRKCPELQCIHVQTLGGETGTEGVTGPVNGGVVHPNDRSLQKACLERYRRASAEIFAVFRQLVPTAKIEKASVDEVYIDVTALVEKELAEREEAATAEHAAVDAFAWGSVVEGGPLDIESEYDRRLSVGASIACRLRGAVHEKLDFTCSAGIAQNKLLAKVGSARNKPNQQTIVTARGIEWLMQGLPLKKLRNFGGKLGAELQSMGATTAGEVAAMPLKQLQQRFGDKAHWILNCVKGLQDDPVTVRELTKSMLAAKTFEATSNMAALERWLGILADELAERMVTDAQLNQRFPRLLVLSYRQKDVYPGRSRSMQMPRAPPPGPTSAMLREAALSALQKCLDALPCCNLGLTATDFQDTPGEEQGCITRFFQPKGQALIPSAENQEARLSSHKAEPTDRERPAQQPSRIAALFKKAAGQSCPKLGPHAEQNSAARESAAGEAEQNSAAHESASQEAERGQLGAGRDDSAAGGHEVSSHRAVEATVSELGVGKGEAELRKAVEQDDCCVRYRMQQGCSALGSERGMETEGSNVSIHSEGDGREMRGSMPGEAAAAGGEGNAGDSGEDELAGVDLEEQKRILHDIWVRKNTTRFGSEHKKRSRTGPEPKGGISRMGPEPKGDVSRTGPEPKGGSAKQPRLTDLFMKKQK